MNIKNRPILQILSVHTVNMTELPLFNGNKINRYGLMSMVMHKHVNKGIKLTVQRNYVSTFYFWYNT